MVAAEVPEAAGQIVEACSQVGLEFFRPLLREPAVEIHRLFDGLEGLVVSAEVAEAAE